MILVVPHMPLWWNGRHKGLKIPRWQQRTGSSPVSGTKNPVHASGRDFYFLLLTSSLLPQNKIYTGFLGSNK